MNISKAAEKSQLSVKTIRYYADIGLVTPASVSASGYRQYDERAIAKLNFVRRSRLFGFSVEECRELLDLYHNQKRSSRDVKKIATDRLEQIQEKQQELQKLHDELAHLVKHCHGDDRPDCPILNDLATSDILKNQS